MANRLRNRLKIGLYGLISFLAGVLFIGQTLLAVEFDASRIDRSGEILLRDGDFGSGRIATPEDAAEFSSSSFFEASGPSDPKVIVYAAFTSNVAPSGSGSDLPDFLPVFSKFFPPDMTFMLVGFRVTKPTKVDIKYEIDPPGGGPKTVVNVTGFGDALNPPSGNLLPGFWYFAWIKPTLALKGLYGLEVKVKDAGPGGDSDKDECRFEIFGP